MTSIVHTHIEWVHRRPGATMWRAVTGGGIYDIEPESEVDRNVEGYVGRLIMIAVEVVDGSSRIVGIAERDHSQKIGQII